MWATESRDVTTVDSRMFLILSLKKKKHQKGLTDINSFHRKADHSNFQRVHKITKSY